MILREPSSGLLANSITTVVSNFSNTHFEKLHVPSCSGISVSTVSEERGIGLILTMEEKKGDCFENSVFTDEETSQCHPAVVCIYCCLSWNSMLTWLSLHSLYLSFLLFLYHSFIATHTLSLSFLCPSLSALFFFLTSWEDKISTTAVGTSLLTGNTVQKLSCNLI